MVMADEETEPSGSVLPDFVSSMDPSEQGTDCLSCHSEIISEGNGHWITSNDDCRFCHDLTLTSREGSDHTTANGNLMLTQTGDYVCVACHADHDKSEQQENSHLDFGCTTCHNPHGSSYGANFVQSEVDLCGGSCHGDWDIGVSHPTGEGIKDISAGVSMSCVSTCHSMHASVEEKLLQVAYDDLCQQCHLDKI